MSYCGVEMWCQKRSGPGCADAYADEADVANIYDGEVPKSDDKYTRGGDAFGRGLGTTLTTCARGICGRKREEDDYV